ncbi:MAG: hypothetical protein J7454_17655 [Roseiflexus sp.]|jgi:hypothetical protein|nr:hypothetical protein [Roseiflexus sp.]
MDDHEHHRYAYELLGLPAKRESVPGLPFEALLSALRMSINLVVIVSDAYS